MFLGNAQLHNITMCIGDEIVLNCTLNTNIHGWTISGDDSKMSITDTDGFREASIGPFTFMLVNTDPFISSVSVEADTELNGIIITCVDAETRNGDTQQAVIEIFGKPTGLFLVEKS